MPSWLGKFAGNVWASIKNGFSLTKKRTRGGKFDDGHGGPMTSLYIREHLFRSHVWGSVKNRFPLKKKNRDETSRSGSSRTQNAAAADTNSPAELQPHYYGEFSSAVVQGNTEMEDSSNGLNAKFVRDGGPMTSLFSNLISETLFYFFKIFLA